MEHRPLKTVKARECGRVGRRKRTGGHDEVPRRPRLAAVARRSPTRADLVERGADEARVEQDALAKPEAIGHVVRVPQQLWLRGVALAPVPLLLELLVEAVRVLEALNVDARVGIAVVVPSAAYAVRRLDDESLQAGPPGPVRHMEAAKARPHDQEIDRAVDVVPRVRAHGPRSSNRTRRAQE